MKLTNQHLVIHQKSPLQHHFDRFWRYCFLIACNMLVMEMLIKQDNLICLLIVLLLALYSTVLAYVVIKEHIAIQTEYSLSDSDLVKIMNRNKEQEEEQAQQYAYIKAYTESVNKAAGRIMNHENPVFMVAYRPDFKAAVKNEVLRRRADLEKKRRWFTI